MRRITISISELAVLASLALFACCVSARGDILLLSDGRQLHGELLEETSGSITFRYFLEGFWTTSTFTRRQIDRLYPEEGDQSDAGENPNERDAALAPAESVTAHLPKVVVIPLYGAVGSGGEDAIRNTFDAHVLRQCLDKAAALDPLAVILDIKSPGGLVTEMEAICETILDYNASLRIVAYPREAYSAAAIIALCCKEMVVHPDARIGAAVMIHATTEGVSAVEAKMASPHHARQRQYMLRSGRPYDVVAAMTIQESELWWCEREGFNASPPPDRHSNEWRLIDGKTTILTMTADDAVEWKLASASAGSPRAALGRLGMAGEIDVVDMDDEIERYNIAMQRRFDELIRQIGVYFGSLGDLRKAMIELGDAYQVKDRDAAKKQKSIIGQQVARIQASGRAITKIDKSLLARRINVPDEALDQMKEDAALLGRITSLVRTDTYDGFNEAVDRLNAVLEAWQQLLN